MNPWQQSSLLAIALLTVWPSAARAQTDFSQCLLRLETVALESGIRPSTVETVLASVEPRATVISADRSQPEFVATFADYLGRRVTDERVSRGRALYAEHRDLLDRLTREHGVPGQYLVAFWGLETNYGGYLGNVPVFDSLSTLACDARRSEYFTEQFVNALRIVDRGDVEPSVMVGSWAGAMGQTQFMPSNYLRYAIDGDGDGRVDLWGSTHDALASAANLLRNLDWRGGERWGREVLLPEQFDYGLAGRDQRRNLNEWRGLGVMTTAAQPIPVGDMRGAVLVPSGYRGPAFLIYDNFDVIMRWNRSEFFAVAVGHLADRIAGAAPLAKPPLEQAPISREAIVRVQEYLAANGYDSGSADGVLGSQSRAAIRELQRDRGWIMDGYLSLEILDALGFAAN
jgi:membrane-bound lytic murein transglycosylase B